MPTTFSTRKSGKSTGLESRNSSFQSPCGNLRRYRCPLLRSVFVHPTGRKDKRKELQCFLIDQVMMAHFATGPVNTLGWLASEVFFFLWLVGFEAEESVPVSSNAYPVLISHYLPLPLPLHLPVKSLDWHAGRHQDFGWWMVLCLIAVVLPIIPTYSMVGLFNISSGVVLLHSQGPGRAAQRFQRHHGERH